VHAQIQAATVPLRPQLAEVAVMDGAPGGRYLGRVPMVAGRPDFGAAAQLAVADGWTLRGTWTARDMGVWEADVDRPEHDPAATGAWY
jgi:hypothetical protein